MQHVRWLLDRIRVNVPFTLLWESHLEMFLEHRIHPEIGLDAAALDRFSTAEFTFVAQKLQARGLSPSFHGPFMDLSPASPDPAVRDLTARRLDQVLPLVPVFKPEKIVCHAGWDQKRYGFRRNAWLRESIAFWTEYARQVRTAGAGLVLENVYEHHPGDLLPLFAGLKSVPVGFCLDTGHQSAFSRASMDIWLDELESYIQHLHLHDNDGTADDHLAIGRGRIDFQGLLTRLARTRQAPSITLEPHTKEDFRPSIERLAELWPWDR